jgi:2-dehydropantoate 2-reductase
MGKKLLFVGAGAIGSYLGAFLTRAGHDVTLVDPWAEQVETIRRHGISVTGPHEPFAARPAAVHLNEAARLPRDYDIAFVAMKAYDTAWAAQLALRHLGPDGYVVAAQNCWPTFVVYGYDGPANNPKGFLLMDPIYGPIYWDKAKLLRNWDAFGRMGIVVYP